MNQNDYKTSMGSLVLRMLENKLKQTSGSLRDKKNVCVVTSYVTASGGNENL